MKIKTIWKAFVLFIITACGVVAAQARDEGQFNTANWKTECVGRYQVSLPGEVEVALSSIQSLMKGENRASFSDGSYPWEEGVSLDGTVEISAIVSASDFQQFKEKYAKPDTEVSVMPLDGSHLDGYKSYWPIHADSGFAKGAEVAVFENQRIYYHFIHNDTEVAKKGIDYFIQNFSTRSLHEIPSSQGICFPYGFVKDDGSQKPYVGVAMRLIDHPDVEIFFKNVYASEEPKNLRPEFKGSRGQVVRFWSRYAPSLGNIVQGTVNHYHKVKLGGFDGVYAFATIVRPQPDSEIRSVGAALLPDETMDHYRDRLKREIAAGKHPLDYGYMAYFKGDPNAKEDTPDLMLYVIRTASRATAVGKQPISEEALKKMAELIAESIKRRPVDAAAK